MTKKNKELPQAITKKEMIEALVANVVEWDLDNLIDYVQADLRTVLSKESYDSIQEEYDFVIRNKFNS